MWRSVPRAALLLAAGDALPVLLERLLELHADLIMEPVGVLLLDEAVGEDARALVRPQLQQAELGRQRRRGAHEDALEAAREVAQVEAEKAAAAEE